MIKTLRITSVAAVVLAAVVLASVLGLLGPASFLRLNTGPGGDKQIDKILSGESAVDRFKAQTGNKAPSGEDTPPLIKQADLFAGIINPPTPEGVARKLPGNLTRKPLDVKPIGPVSGKFDLLGICYSDDPKASYAYIQLVDKTLQWAGVGSEIGHMKIKEIRKGSVVCWDGKQDVTMTATTQETSSLLETGKAPVAPAASEAAPAAAETAPVSPVNPAGPANPASATPPAASLGRGARLQLPLRPAQMSKEEQESLSRLGNELRANAADPNGGPENDKLIADLRARMANPPQVGVLPNPADANAKQSNWKETMKEREERLRVLQKRLAPPRSTKK
jgi:hypothetical protein